MKYRAVRKIILSQIAFIVGLIVCYILWPKALGAIHAISDYGTTMQTVIPYAIGFTASSILMLQAARELPPAIPENRNLARVLYILCAILLVVLITPYKVNKTFFILHMTAGLFLYGTQIISSGWMAFTVRRDSINVSLFLLQVVSGLVMVLAFDQIGVLPRYLVGLGQLVAFNAFAILLMRVVMQVEKVHLSQVVEG